MAGFGSFFVFLLLIKAENVKMSALDIYGMLPWQASDATTTTTTKYMSQVHRVNEDAYVHTREAITELLALAQSWFG